MARRKRGGATRARPARPPGPPNPPHPGHEPLTLSGLEVLRWAHGGDAVAVPDGGPLAGAVVFIPDAVPGDRVKVAIVERKSRWARARLLEVERPSRERVTPECPVQARCGGCPWMVGSAAAQRDSRLAILRGEAQKRLGWSEGEALARVEVADPQTPAPRTGYRPRIKLAWRAVAAGPASLGFRRKGSHALVPVAACAVADPAINAALPELARQVGARARGEGALTVVAGREGVAAWVAPEVGDGFAIGLDEVTVAMGAREHRVTPRAFLQANPPVAAAMVDAIEALAVRCGPGHAVELFAGSGALTPALWRAGFSVDAYELDGAGEAPFIALRDGLGVSAERGRWAQADLLGVGVPLPSPRERADLVLLDPPRGGAASIMPWVRASGARHVILMSCDVATAFRDLAALAADPAWRVEGVVGYDMFPHTGHQELLAYATRAG